MVTLSRSLRHGLTGVFGLALMVAACAPAQPNQARAPQGGSGQAAAGQQSAPGGQQSGGAPRGTITIGLNDYGPGERWLPWLGGVPDHQIMAAVYDYLFGRKAGTDQLEGRLAERHEWSPDNTALKLYLRKGVQFHDGKGELTAEDVVFSLERYMATDRAPGVPYFRETIGGIAVVDPYTVELRLKQPDWSLPHNLANASARVAIVSKKYVEQVGEDQAGERPIGTGPFRFVEAQRRSYVKLEAVENHWRQTPAMKTLVIRKIPEDGTRLAALRAGEVDIIDVLYEHVAELTSAGYTMVPIRHARSVFITLGGQNPPNHRFYDRSVPWVGPDRERARTVRQALGLAVDRKAIVDKIYAGQADIVAVPSFRPGMPWTDPALQPYPYDPARAKELLTRAGYPSGFPIKLMSVTGQGAEFPQVTEAVAGYWTRHLGLQVEIQPIEWGTIRPKMVARDTLGMAWPHGMQTNVDPEPAVSHFNQWTCEGNYISVACDEEMDRQFDALLQETNEQRRVDIRKNIAKIVYDNYYVVPIAQAHLVFAADPKKVAAWPLIPGSVYPVNYEYIQLAR